MLCSRLESIPLAVIGLVPLSEDHAYLRTICPLSATVLSGPCPEAELSMVGTGPSSLVRGYRPKIILYGVTPPGSFSSGVIQWIRVSFSGSRLRQVRTHPIDEATLHTIPRVLRATNPGVVQLHLALSGGLPVRRPTTPSATCSDVS